MATTVQRRVALPVNSGAPRHPTFTQSPPSFGGTWKVTTTAATQRGGARDPGATRLTPQLAGNTVTFQYAHQKRHQLATSLTL